MRGDALLMESELCPLLSAQYLGQHYHVSTSIGLIMQQACYSGPQFYTHCICAQAVVTELKRMNKTGRPVLVGTTSVEKSETLSALLIEEGIKHQVCVMI